MDQAHYVPNEPVDFPGDTVANAEAEQTIITEGVAGIHIIRVSEDRLLWVAKDHLDRARARRLVAPVGTIGALLTTLLTADFRTVWFLTADVIHALYWVALIVAGGVWIYQWNVRRGVEEPTPKTLVEAAEKRADRGPA